MRYLTGLKTDLTPSIMKFVKLVFLRPQEWFLVGVFIGFYLMDTFTWLPDKGIKVETDLMVREVQFGEGVVQVQAKNLMKSKRKFSISFERPVEMIDAIESFLLNQRGKRFVWQRTSGNIMVRCTELSRTVTGIVDTLDCTFQEEHI